MQTAPQWLILRDSFLLLDLTTNSTTELLWRVSSQALARQLLPRRPNGSIARPT